jgi:hypothetical protein
MSKESFLLYHGYYEPIKPLSLEEKGRLFEAIFEYSINGIEPPTTSRIYMAFLFFKNQINQDTKKYERISKERAEIGKKGGLKTASKIKQTLPNGSKSLKVEANQADTDTVTDTVTDTDTYTDWLKWADLIVNGGDHIWEQMRGRKVTKEEMDSFISVAVRNKWTMETQHQFRLSLNGFKSGTEKKEVKNKYKT